MAEEERRQRELKKRLEEQKSQHGMKQEKEDVFSG